MSPIRSKSLTDSSRLSSSVGKPSMKSSGLLAVVGSQSGSSLSEVDINRHPPRRSSTSGKIFHRRTSNSGSEGSDFFNDNNDEIDDPVGDLITQMLNDGRVPGFGYHNYTIQSVDDEDFSQLTLPLISSRNYVVIRNFFRTVCSREYWTNEEQLLHDRPRESPRTMRFILESFALSYIIVYSLNDMMLRFIYENTVSAVCWVISTFLFDVESVQDYILQFLRSLIPQCCIDFVCFIEGKLLWGDRFQGRILLWNDEETLLKFRSDHGRLLTLQNELKQNRRARKQSTLEKRRKRRRGEVLTNVDMVRMAEEESEKVRLQAAIIEYTRRVPTFFHDQIESLDGIEIRHPATQRHMDALQFCQKMVSIEVEEQSSVKPVSLETTSNGNPSSSNKTIQVVDDFPDIHLDKSDESDSIDLSQIFSGESSSFEDDDDSLSGMSNNSCSTSRSMPWMVVGAKIGQKLLNSRKLQRVIANPDAAQKLISHEAKKLIGGIDETISDESDRSQSKFNDSRSVDETSQKASPLVPQKSDQISPPVHGMRRRYHAGQAMEAINLYSARAFSSENKLDSLDSNYSSATSSCIGEVGVGEKRFFPADNLSPQAATQVPVSRLAPLATGVKIVVPMFSLNCSTKWNSPSFYQMGTVISSHRINVESNKPQPPPSRFSFSLDKSRSIKSTLASRISFSFDKSRSTNCLLIKVLLDKAFLRGGKFVEMDLRIMDAWGLMPRHSKFPIGSCVATSFGIGVLVGWRVEDDCHIIRSLWKRAGPGSGAAYLRRESIHRVVEAAVGFDVQTTFGAGNVVAYVRGGKRNITGKYLVSLAGRRKGQVLEFDRCQILSCQDAAFTPVTEHIRAAAIFRLQVLQYKAKLREQMINGSSTSNAARDKGTWRNFSEYVDLFATSLTKAMSEDPDFDYEFDKFFTHLIDLLEGASSTDEKNDSTDKKAPQSTLAAEMNANNAKASDTWNINDFFASFFVDTNKVQSSISVDQDVLLHAQKFDEAHESAQVLIRVLLRTISVAKAAVPDRPQLHIVLAMIHEALLLVRQICKVQRMHTSKKLIEAWFQALRDISDTFGPLKERLAALGRQIENRMRKHGSVIKRRILRFVDIILGDTVLLHSVELGFWRESLARVEAAIVKAGITDAATCEQLHNGLSIMYKNLAPRKKDKKTRAAASRNGKKLIKFAKLMKIVASPGRSILRILTYDEVLVLFDRVLVRIFEKDPQSSLVINVMAFNFDSIRHLRTLNNMSIAGKLWETVLDAIDEELTFATSEIPEQTKYFLDPFVKLFTLGVAHFHLVMSGDSTADWLDFLMEDDAVKIIQELDYKLIHSLEALCNDIKQVVQVLPYIKTIDNDILNLMDEFDFDEFLKDMTDVMGHPEKWVAYMTEKSAIFVERFLDYLPRMSIPIERLPLQDGWVLTCRSKDGGDLRLSDVGVLRENLLLSVMGGDNVFLGGSNDYIGSPRSRNNTSSSSVFPSATEDEEDKESVLNDVRELILSARSHGAWIAGVGGLEKPTDYDGVPQELAGLPLSHELRTQIDLWQTSAISDIEFLQTAIREVTVQIQLQKEREEYEVLHPHPPQSMHQHFDPKSDPTVIFLDIKNLTLRLEEFGFRVEKAQPKLFDPVFEGRGSITVKNVSITLRVEVKKETIIQHGRTAFRPVLDLCKFEIRLERLKLAFRETGADWLWNALMKGFRNQITDIVQINLRENIEKQVHAVLGQLNDFVSANPHLLFNALGITMKDLEER